MNKVTVDKTRLLRRVIVISWITLALCFVVKIFGGNFFEIMSNNKNYKALCDYVDSHFWLKYIIAVLSSMFSISLYLLAILQRYKFIKTQFLCTAIVIFISCYLKLKIELVGAFCDIVIMFILPFIYLKGVKWQKRLLVILIAFVFNFAFQLLSLVTKNMAIKVMDDSTFITLIYGIDIYIMCFLYYLYRNYKKEQEDMGAFFVLFMGKPADKLRAMKAKREAKIKKLEAEVNAIEVELSKRKKDEK